MTGSIHLFFNRELMKVPLSQWKLVKALRLEDIIAVKESMKQKARQNVYSIFIFVTRLFGQRAGDFASQLTHQREQHLEGHWSASMKNFQPYNISKDIVPQVDSMYKKLKADSA